MILWIAAMLPLAVCLFVKSGAARLCLILAMALLVFQTTEGLSAPKICFFTMIVAVLGMEAMRGKLAISRATAVASIVLVLLTVASLIRGNSPVITLRDSSNYLLLLTIEPLSTHFGRRLSSRTVRRLSIAIGVAAAYSFTATWSGKRNLGSLPEIGMSSSVLFGFVVAMASAIAVTSSKSRRWWTLAAVLITAGVLTGTRNLLLLLLPPIIIAIYVHRITVGSERAKARRAIRRAVAVFPVVCVVVLAASVALSLDVSGALSRIATVGNLSQNGASNSLVERQIQQAIAWKSIVSSPIIGSGPGTLWQIYRPTSNDTVTGFTMDTSLVVFAKWGLVGGLALLGLLWCWWRKLRPNRARLNIWSLTALGLFPFFFAQSMLSAQIEDRGLPIALLLLGVGRLSHMREEREIEQLIAEEALYASAPRVPMGVG